MSEEDTKASETPNTPPNLEKQLAELNEKQDAAAAAEANYAGLEKLIEDTQKAEGDYAKAYYQLQDQETRLTTERDALSRALQAALGDAGIAAVRETVTEMVNAVSRAKTARDNAKTAVDRALSAADERAQELAAAQGKLDVWRKPGDSIGKRLKTAEGLIEEIKKLRNACGRGEAYWKLALGGHADVPGQEFLNTVLSRQPEVIHPDDLGERIRTVWDGFRAARTAAAEANAALATAQADLKQKKADFADISKNLIKTISAALAMPEAASEAA